MSTASSCCQNEFPVSTQRLNITNCYCVFLCNLSLAVQAAPSVPRKLQAQWNMGVIQAKEALGMALDERMVNFTFLYDDDGPHLNPLIMEKLKPEQSDETNPAMESRLSPDPPSLMVGGYKMVTTRSHLKHPE